MHNIEYTQKQREYNHTPSVETVTWFTITLKGKDWHASAQDPLCRVPESVMFDFGCAVVNLGLGFLAEWDKHVMDVHY